VNDTLSCPRRRVCDRLTSEHLSRHFAVMFNSTCILLALENAQPRSWAVQAAISDVSGSIDKAVHIFEEYRSRGGHIETAHRTLTCLRPKGKQSESIQSRRWAPGAVSLKDKWCVPQRQM